MTTPAVTRIETIRSSGSMAALAGNPPHVAVKGPAGDWMKYHGFDGLRSSS